MSSNSNTLRPDSTTPTFFSQPVDGCVLVALGHENGQALGAPNPIGVVDGREVFTAPGHAASRVQVLHLRIDHIASPSRTPVNAT